MQKTREIDCADCEMRPCICETEETQHDMLTTVLDVMKEKVQNFQKIMQDRVLMIKEDIVATISEETSIFQKIINSNITKLDNFMEDIQDNEGEIELSPDLVDAMTYNFTFNLNSSTIQEGFNQALHGQFVIFRELMKSKNEIQ